MDKMNIKVNDNNLKRQKLMHTIRPGTTKIKTKNCFNMNHNRVKTMNSPFREAKMKKVAQRPITVRNKYWKSAKPRELFYLNQLNRKEHQYKNNYNVKEKAKRMNFSQADSDDNYIIFKRRSNKKGRRFNETTIPDKAKRRTFSV